MTEIELLIDLHKGSDRQGPGSDAETKKALDLAGIDLNAPLNIADIGCGTGASTLFLARTLNARVTAVDFIQEFLDRLEKRAESAGLSNKITPLCCSMDQLPFENREYDLIWSEGAIYNIGFKQGVRDWHRFLKPGGLLVVSEITWITGSRPAELQEHWETEYPEIDTASSKMAVLEKSGYAPLGYFVLPEYCWTDRYYGPLQDGFGDFLQRNDNSKEARDIVEAERKEIDLYQTYKAHYSYGVYIARKI